MEKHDYTAACIYLITVTTEGRKRVLGSLMGESPDTATIEPTTLGKYVVEAFRKIAAETTRKTGCRVQVLHYQIMPDHFQVHTRTDPLCTLTLHSCKNRRIVI